MAGAQSDPARDSRGEPAAADGDDSKDADDLEEKKDEVDVQAG